MYKYNKDETFIIDKSFDVDHVTVFKGEGKVTDCWEKPDRTRFYRVLVKCYDHNNGLCGVMLVEIRAKILEQNSQHVWRASRGTAKDIVLIMKSLIAERDEAVFVDDLEHMDDDADDVYYNMNYEEMIAFALDQLGY